MPSRAIHAICVFVLVLALYSVFVETNMITASTVTVASDALYPYLHNLKVVHISDLHITSIGFREKNLVGMLNRIKPDILFITGDLLTFGKDEASCIEVLKQISKPKYGTWAVLGNTDRYSKSGDENNMSNFIRELHDAGIRVLEDSYGRLLLNGDKEPLFVLGVEGPHLSRSKLEWLLKDVPDGAPVILLSHYPDVLEKNTEALTVNLQESEEEGPSGWGWQDNAFFTHDTGRVRFEKDGKHTVRVQRREDGAAIEQICLVAGPGDMPHFIRPMSGTANICGGINPDAGETIMVKVKDIPDAHIFGSWKKVHDPTADLDPVLKDMPDLGEKNEIPLMEPENYFEADFYAGGGVDYHVWVRMKAAEDSGSSDSVYIQFNDSIDQKGEPVYRTGEYGVRKGLKRIGLVLAGHTHGGQVRFPVIGALDNPPGHKIIFDMGLFESGGTKMYVNRGIGTTMLPMRLLSRPEITIFEFMKEKM